jgi:hypothetical protein
MRNPNARCRRIRVRFPPPSNQIFGPDNTATHVLATEGDLGRPRDVVRLAEELTRKDTGLPPTRIGPVHINTARAHLDLGNREGAQAHLFRPSTSSPRWRESTR